MVTISPRKDVPPRTPRRFRWLIVALVVALAAAIVAVAVLATRHDKAKPASSGSVSPTTSAPASLSPSAPSASSPSASSASSPAAPAPFQLGYLPLYPFASRADALAWLRSNRSGGHQPWHLDAGMTAASFVAWLRFTEIDLVTSRVTDSLGAHIGVGYRDPNGATQTAAVLHLVRFGPEADAPWEVVGSDDTTLSLETPAYGSRVTSPVTVGGHITGVDENIHVTMRQLSNQRPLGESGGIPAGGDNQPWSATVSFVGASEPTLTIVATTGGHLQQVERFAIQGVRH